MLLFQLVFGAGPPFPLLKFEFEFIVATVDHSVVSHYSTLKVPLLVTTLSTMYHAVLRGCANKESPYKKPRR